MLWFYIFIKIKYIIRKTNFKNNHSIQQLTEPLYSRHAGLYDIEIKGQNPPVTTVDARLALRHGLCIADLDKAGLTRRSDTRRTHRDASSERGDNAVFLIGNTPVKWSGLGQYIVRSYFRRKETFTSFT